jgi:nucleotide-binding universal stress UspA family protein
MYRRILVPIDGSSTAQRGLQEAFGLAKAFDSSLMLLHVVEVYPMMMEMATATTWEQVTTDLRTQGRQVLERAHESAQAVGVACEAHLEDAAAARVCDVIVDQARADRLLSIAIGCADRSLGAMRA